MGGPVELCMNASEIAGSGQSTDYRLSLEFGYGEIFRLDMVKFSGYLLCFHNYENTKIFNIV
jgi:hypothetical protein